MLTRIRQSGPIKQRFPIYFCFRAGACGTEYKRQHRPREADGNRVDPEIGSDGAGGRARSVRIYRRDHGGTEHFSSRGRTTGSNLSRSPPRREMISCLMIIGPSRPNRA